MQLEDLPQQVDRWIRQNGDYWDSFQILARLTEELGEIAGALQRIGGLRPRKPEADLELEMGDSLFTLTAFANRNKIQLEQAVRRAIEKYDQRNSADWQKTHHNS